MPDPITAATAVTAVATMAIAILTWYLAQENRRLRRDMTRPRLVAYLELHPDEFQVINFVVRNVGGGVAQNVKLRTPSNLAIKSLGLSGDWKSIGSLAQDQTYTNFHGQAPDLFNPKQAPFEVEVSYQGLQGRDYKDRFPLDVAQFEGLTTLDSSPERDTVAALKEISRKLSNGIVVKTR